MAVTQGIGTTCGYILRGIVRMLTGIRVHPNVLTSIGLAINVIGAFLFARGEFFTGGLVVLLAAVFDLVDGPVARQSNRVSRFGGFLDSVLDRHSDLILLMGLLVYYASINRFFYIVLTGIAMTGAVMVSYTRARSENFIESCKVGFLERPERIVLLLIGALFNRMAPVIWVIAVFSNITVLHRCIHTWRETKKLDDADAARSGVKTEAGVSASPPAGREVTTEPVPGNLR